jgi:hypothetical protein
MEWVRVRGLKINKLGFEGQHHSRVGLVGVEKFQAHMHQSLDHMVPAVRAAGNQSLHSQNRFKLTQYLEQCADISGLAELHTEPLRLCYRLSIFKGFARVCL